MHGLADPLHRRYPLGSAGLAGSCDRPLLTVTVRAGDGILLAEVSRMDRSTLQAEALYQQWRQQRLRVGTHDLRIAAICLAHAATFISRNHRDSTQGPGLQVEFWD